MRSSVVANRLHQICNHARPHDGSRGGHRGRGDRKSTRLNSSHGYISYAVFCLKKKKTTHERPCLPHRFGNPPPRAATCRCALGTAVLTTREPHPNDRTPLRRSHPAVST